jgi:hypothetical protein
VFAGVLDQLPRALVLLNLFRTHHVGPLDKEWDFHPRRSRRIAENGRTRQSCRLFPHFDCGQRFNK